MQNIVILDPGHGGVDPGTVIDDIKEKDINLKIALKVKEKLEQKEISAYDLDKEFGEFCQKSFPHCRNCKYDMDNLCKIKWILDTYNLTKK